MDYIKLLPVEEQIQVIDFNLHAIGARTNYLVNKYPSLKPGSLDMYFALREIKELGANHRKLVAMRNSLIEEKKVS